MSAALRDVPNPDLEKACGLDISIILDESGSVKDYKKDVQNAFRAFTSALKNTGSRLAVSEFSTVANLPLTGAARDTYTPVTDQTIASTFDPYINNQYNPNGSTNWEDGLRVSRYMLPKPSAQPHLVVFITDGDPNKVIRRDRVTQDEYENQVPLASSDMADASYNDATQKAVPNADGIKAMDSHILAIAVGAGLDSNDSLNRLKAVSGPDVYDGTGTFDISTTDVYREPDFSKLQDALREAAFQLCAPSVTIRKMVDLTPDTDVSDAVPGPNLGINARVTPEPATWVLPADGSGSTARTRTDANGFANFQWDTQRPMASTATFTEDDPAGQVPGLVFDPDLTRCTYRTPDHPNDQNLPVVDRDMGFQAVIPPDAIVTCTIYNVLPAAPSISLEKATNGVDADDPPGPRIPVGDDVTWTYTVLNDGNVTVNTIELTDNREGAISCPQSRLLPGDSMTCTATGTAQAGAYDNRATVTGDYQGQTVRDSDPSHYTGVRPGIDIEKATNGEDADEAPGPYVAPGDPVEWTYVVTNNGEADLTDITVVDDQIGPITCPTDSLVVGDSMTCTANGTAVAGQYENNATVTGRAGGQTIRDSDASHYFGGVPSVDIEKYTNGRNADSAPGPQIPVRRPVLWVYVVTNTGNVPLDDLSVTDDQGVTVRCPPLGQLLPGEVTACFALGRAQAGQYANIGSVSATDPSGGAVSDSDPSHYFGVRSSIDMTKYTNGEDANDAPGPIIDVGGGVTWTYVIENTVNVALHGIDLTDSVEGDISCPANTLAVGDSMTCTATGTAIEGQYENTGYVVGTDTLGKVVTADDPSHYYGAAPGISVEKSTNGDDADVEPGPYIEAGKNVRWEYVVVNSGNLPLTDVHVTDDQGVTVTCPQDTLAVDESMTCVGTGVAERGQYANIATATGDANGTTLTDTDPSHYFGYVTALRLTKYTNGFDANRPTGPYIRVGDRVHWTYVIENTGDVPIESWQITDSDPSVAIRCPRIGLIQPGRSLTCAATGTATKGQYENTAEANALDILENRLSDDDPSHYFGAAPSIDLEKSTNGDDADLPTGPQVIEGTPVTWRYVVTNTGNVPLESVAVTDNRNGAVDCPRGRLTIGATMTCVATGTATVGQYSNVGRATGEFIPRQGDPMSVSDRDPSHYFGMPEGGGEDPGEPGGPGGGDPGGPGGDLPGTGAVLWPLALGLLLVVAGSGMVMLARRRRSQPAHDS